MTEENPVVVVDEDATTTGDTIVPVEKPVEKPAEEAPKEEPKVDEAVEDAAKFEYNTYDDIPALKHATTILKDANLPVEEANAIFAKAIEAGDIALIDRAALTEKIGKDKAEIVLALAESYYNGEFAKYKAQAAAIHDSVGGEAVFNDMKSWALKKEATDPAFKAELEDIRETINTGKPRAVKAAFADLFALYKADPNTTIPASITKGDATVNTSGLSPLTRKEYTDECTKAHNNGTYEKVHAELWARRQLGMQQKN